MFVFTQINPVLDLSTIKFIKQLMHTCFGLGCFTLWLNADKSLKIEFNGSSIGFILIQLILAIIEKKLLV